MALPQNQPTHYEVLQISSAFLSEQKDQPIVLRRAYHRALLCHHPDKTPSPSSFSSHSSPAPGRSNTTPTPSLPATDKPRTNLTVDHITEAFRVLSDPRARIAYDKELRLHRSAGQRLANGQQDDFQTGIETTDLDDLEYDQDKLCWFRACRCGNERGFLCSEDDLNEASDHGELVVGCQGCSLWIKVHFAVVDE